MAETGLEAYRLSISWSRLIPSMFASLYSMAFKCLISSFLFSYLDSVFLQMEEGLSTQKDWNIITISSMN